MYTHIEQAQYPDSTDSELAILLTLWSRRPSSVREIRARLDHAQPCDYTTVLKIMQLMFGKGTRLCETEWQARADALAQRFHIHRPILLLLSSQVQTPAIIGCIRAVIFLPVGALVGFPPQQIEGLLAHELAHIRRYDHFANLCQRSSKRCSFITLPSGGFRNRCALSVKSAAMTWQ